MHELKFVLGTMLNFSDILLNLDTLNDFTDVTLACDDGFKELRISNPHDSRSFFKDP